MEPLDDSVESRLGDGVRFAFRHFPLTEDGDLRGYAAELDLDLERFEADWASAGVLARIRRDVESGLATGEVLGTPTLFVDGVVHRGSYDADSLEQAR
jgi:NhaA family Na+:H+ antiporter